MLLPHIAVHLAQASARAVVEHALRGHARLAFCTSPRLLLAFLNHHGAEAVMVGLTDATGRPLSAFIRALRRAFPALPIMGVSGATPGCSREIVAAARSGVDSIALLHPEDLRASLRETLTWADTEDGAFLRGALAGAIAPEALPLIDACVSHASEAPASDGVALLPSVSRRTLSRRFASAGLMPPGECLRWVRIVLAARSLQDPRVTVERAALEFQFGTPSGFRRSLYQLTGMRPGELRRSDAFDRLVECFANACRASSRMLSRRCA